MAIRLTDSSSCWAKPYTPARALCRVVTSLKITWAPAYCDAAMLRGGDGSVVGIAVVIGAVVMVERRNGQQHAGLEGMHPGEVDQRVALALHVADAGSLRVRIVGNLVIVAPKRRDEPELVGRHRDCK